MLNVHAKAIAAAAICAAKDDVRYYLNGVYFEPCDTGGVHVVATDGHRMLHILDPDGTCNAPVILAFDPQAVTKMKQARAERVKVSARDDEVIAELTGIKHISYATRIDGTYPKWRAVVPATLPETSCPMIAIDGAYLADFGTIAGLLDCSHSSMAIVNGEDPHRPVYVVFEKPRTGLRARGVLMPLKSDAGRETWEIENAPQAAD